MGRLNPGCTASDCSALRRYQFTSKLESMFTDIKTSRDAMHSFKQYQAGAASTSGASADADIELSVQVGFPGPISAGL